MSKDWNNDWDIFSDQLIELLDAGASEAEISDLYRGKDVQWNGLIKSVNLHHEYAPGIVISMSDKDKPMANDRALQTSHVSLQIPVAEQESWKGSEVGEWVDFTACIPAKDKSKVIYRPEIGFSEFEGSQVVSLKLILVNCERLGVNSQA